MKSEGDTLCYCKNSLTAYNSALMYPLTGVMQSVG